MKTIGLIGGMSWESTATYYTSLNTLIAKKLGGLHSAKCLLYSVDFAEIEHYQRTAQWEKAGGALATAALNLQNAGAECIAICTNTMHKVAPAVEAAISVPLLHIADATASALAAAGVQKAALLGTRYTMEQPFYKERLTAKGIEVLVPGKEARARIDQIIFSELCLGKLEAPSKAFYLDAIQELATQGAGAIILGCTEIGLLVKQADTSIPLFDTTAIHTKAIAAFALGEKLE